MNSLWKNLLFLHGHITHTDLAWRPDTRTEPDRCKGAARKLKAIVPMCCASIWPRLIGPR
jgi:hypothetical protein